MKFSADGKEHSIAEVRSYAADYFSLSDDDKAERIPSGKQTKLENRIYWTKSYFDKAELIHSTRWGHFQISELGMKYYESCNGNITIADLKEIPKFREFHQGSNSSTTDRVVKSASVDNSFVEDKTPLERLEEAHGFIQKELAEGLLDKMKSNSWQFFEDLVIDLMIVMGYGGSRNKAGQSMKRTNDEGIDGIINEDKLGLDVIYLQAKKWTKEGGIGRPEIQKFVGVLHGQRAKKRSFYNHKLFHKYCGGICKDNRPQSYPHRWANFS